MSTQSYQGALEILKLVLNSQIFDDPKLDRVWPTDHDDLLDEIYNDIIELWGEVIRNQGRIDKKGIFYLSLVTAHHILEAKLDPKLSMELHGKILDERVGLEEGELR